MTASQRDFSETPKDWQTLSQWVNQRVSLLNTSWAKCHLATFYGAFTICPRAFVITANVQTSMWGQNGEVLFLSVHSLSLLDSSLKQRAWGQKGKK